MLYSFEGPQGVGKSMSAISLAVEEYFKNGRKIISNNHINNIPYQHFNLEWFVDNIATNEMEDCVLFLDEAYQYMDSRMSQSKVNRLFTYFIVQTRKRGVDMYICTHHIDNIDLRLRRAIDIRGACSYFGETPCKRCKCKECGGTGKINDATCPYCVNGSGGTGKYKGDEAFCIGCNGTGKALLTEEKCKLCEGTGWVQDTCSRCLGWGQTGVGRVHFLRVRGRGQKRRFTMEVFGPKYWGYYSTKERMPMQQRLLTSIDTLEIV